MKRIIVYKLAVLLLMGFMTGCVQSKPKRVNTEDHTEFKDSLTGENNTNCFRNNASQSAESHNTPIVDIENESKGEVFLSHRQWCSLIDSLVDLGKQKMADKEVGNLLEKGRKLNKEKKVYSALNILFNGGGTLYMMIKMNRKTSNVFISCWRRVSGEFNTDNIYNYRYYRHRTGYLPGGDSQYEDTVYINNDPERQIFSERLLRTCNLWDVKQLRSNKNMDGVYGDFIYTIAYKIDIFKNGKFRISDVPVVTQGEKSDEISIPYEILKIK